MLDAFATFQAAQNIAPKTIHNRKSILGPLMRWMRKPLLEATVIDLRAYLARGGVAPGTLRVERAAMVAFYDWAVSDGLLPESPARRLAPIRVPKGTPRPFSPEQVQRMLHSGAYKRTRAMILIGYFQGFRVSQIARVHGRDIDLWGKTIRTVAKGNKEARLPLHETIRELAFDMPRDDWWFPSPVRTGPIHGASVTDAITEAKRRAGITDPKLTPHSLRHSFGSNLVEAGVDIRIVQELMLHEDLSTTQVYTKVSDDKKREGINSLATITYPEESHRLRLVA